MSQVRTVIFDNVAVQALVDVDHGKHRQVLAIVEAVAARNLRRSGSVGLVAPVAVRVEAGWDRRTPRAAAIDRLRIRHEVLDGQAGDFAAAARNAVDLSVADAHIAAFLETTAAPHAVVTSDHGDLRRIASRLAIDVVRI